MYNLKKNRTATKSTTTKSYDGMREKTPLVANHPDRSIDDYTIIREPSMEQEEPTDNDSSSAVVWAATKLTLLFAIITILNLFSGGPGPAGLEACGNTCFGATQAVMGARLWIFAIYQRQNLLSKD
jgi:hypothetical protein